MLDLTAEMAERFGLVVEPKRAETSVDRGLKRLLGVLVRFNPDLFLENEPGEWLNRLATELAQRLKIEKFLGQKIQKARKARPQIWTLDKHIELLQEAERFKASATGSKRRNDSDACRHLAKLPKWQRAVGKTPRGDRLGGQQQRIAGTLRRHLVQVRTWILVGFLIDETQKLRAEAQRLEA
jgi:hypothetical protein